jgi:hypothetical protein
MYSPDLEADPPAVVRTAPRRLLETVDQGRSIPLGRGDAATFAGTFEAPRDLVAVIPGDH